MSNENINKSIDLFYKNMNIYILHRSNELDHEKGRPAILLKYRTKVSLVWIGTHKIDKKTKEKPLVIIINKIKGYYYSIGIERVRSKDLVGRWINFQTNDSYFLTTNEQQKLISKFVSFTLEQDPYVKIKELELKLQKKDKENQELKKQICVQALKLKNRNHG